MVKAFTVIDGKNHKEWLKNRTYGIGGSDASAIVGMNPYKTNIELFEEKTGEEDSGRHFPETLCTVWNQGRTINTGIIQVGLFGSTRCPIMKIVY